MKMFKMNKGKHCAEKVNTKSFNVLKFIVTIFLIVWLIFSHIAHVLSYFTDSDTKTNQIEIEGTYTIHYVANGGTGTMPDQIIFCTLSTNLNRNTFEYTPYAFDGWNTDPDGLGTAYTDGQSVSNLGAAGSSITLYAQWTDETNEAEIVGGQKYPTLQQAINAAGSGATVRVLKNIQLTAAANVASSKNIILDIQSFTLSNKNHGDINIIKNAGTLEIISGTIESDAEHGAIDNDSTGNLKVSGGQIIATGERQAIYNSGGTVEVTGTAFLRSDATDRPTIQNFKPNNKNAGTITISGGTIVSTTTTTKGAVQNEATGTVIITGGTITSENLMGVDNSGTLIIGVEDDEADITDPVIQGATYGVKTSGSATVEFYDGIVKGKTHAFNNESAITDKEDDYEIEHGSESIGGNTYETAYLDNSDYKVKFNGNGGTPTETSMFVTPNTQIGSLPAAPTRYLHTFNGWYTDPDNGTQVTTSTVITAPITFYAHWTKTQAEITFNPGRGTTNEPTRVVNINSTIGTPLPTATETGKVFVGWFTDPNNGTQIDGTETVTADITYYAHYSAPPVKATFIPGQGATVSETERDVEEGDTLGTGGPLPVPTCSGMYFAGWYTDPTAGDRVTEDTIILEDTDYYAHWISSAVARIGPVNYTTLQAAVNDVPTNNTETTILLLADTLEAVDVAANKNIILDLQNHTLSNNGTKIIESEQVTMRNRGTITITNGTVSGDTNSATINNELNGRLIIIDANITHTNKKSKQAIYNNGGTLEISGTAYISSKNGGEYGGYARGAIQNLVNDSHVGTIIITGGTVESSTGPAIVNQSGTILTIGTEDGTATSTTPEIKGLTYGVINSSNAVFNFYDGIVKGKTNSVSGTITDHEDGATEVDSTDANSYYIKYFE